jgi:apolipoprotein N-acyltransferase
LGQKKLKILFLIVCFLTSAILLTVIQSPFNLGYLAWFALVPFVLGSLLAEPVENVPIFSTPVLSGIEWAKRPKEKIGSILLAAYVISFFYWLGNLYWLMLTTVPGWIAFCLYMALYWPILAASLRHCLRMKIPLWISLPVLIVCAESLQGLIFNGFDWRYLGHSQYKNIAIIQIADIFGASGVTFLVAMVNGLIAEAVIDLKEKRFLTPANNVGVFLTALAVSSAIFYGQFRIAQTADFVEAGPRIGVVQSNVPVKAGEETDPFENTFINMLSDSRDCLLSVSPGIIIWPETMVEAVLDDSYLNLAAENDIAKIFHNALVRHSNQGVYLLVGAFAGDAVIQDDRIKLATNYNSAFLYEPNSVGPRQVYNKMHLVPFGEYIPLIDILPFLNRFFIMLTPYDYDYALDAGDKYTVFEMDSTDKTYRFGVMICYEDTVPKIASNLTLDRNKDKQIDWLVNISNDGWFVRRREGKIIATTELAQHMAISVFRAVENRVPIFRSVNTGISCYIDSLGRIHNDYIAGTLAEKTAERIGQNGWFVDQVFIDKRVTFFSRAGQELEVACAVCLIFVAFMSIYRIVMSN